MPKIIKRGETGGPVEQLALLPKQGTAEDSHDLNRQALSGPSVRLALGADIIKTVGGKALRAPTVRLARLKGQAEREGNDTLGPAIRLALPLYSDSDTGSRKKMNEALSKGPTVRLASSDKGGNTGGENLVRNLTKGVGQPHRGLAHKVNNQGDRTLEEGAPESPTVRLVGQSGGESNTSILPRALIEAEEVPALLVSYVYLGPFLKNRPRYHYRDWALDSGAFSAHNSGTEIKLQDYIDCCKELMQSDPTLTDIFALDVIGDWKASLKNTEEMWRQEVPAIPCFHYGEPWETLKGLAKDYPKVAIGGCVGVRSKDKFAGQCFSRVWPKKLHGFGFGSEKSILLYPWHSVDATNWEIAPCKYGQWKAFDTQRVSVRGSQQNLRAEVEWYLDLERRAREKWKKEMAKLEEPNHHTTRLAVEASSSGGKRAAEALAPAVRLVGNGDVVCGRQIEAFGKAPKKKGKRS